MTRVKAKLGRTSNTTQARQSLVKGGGLVGTDEGETCFWVVGWVRIRLIINSLFGTFILLIGGRGTGSLGRVWHFSPHKKCSST